jgi:outer membrane receptor protein involved in Fe transport
VYWNRVPQAAIDRVEVVRGATGDLYGADALGGVIQVLTFPSSQPRVRATIDGGSHDTARVSVFGAGRTAAGLTASAAGELLETGGVFAVGSEARGVVDTRAGSDYRTGYGTIGYTRDNWHASARANVYTEERENGTPVEVNDTQWRQFSGEAGGITGGAVWSAQVAGGTQSYYQTFALTAADRATQRLLRDQNIDSSFVTYGGQWLKAFGATTVLVGGDGHRTDGNMREVTYTAAGAPLAPVLAGGIENVGSIYGRIIHTASDRVTVSFGARGDFWRSDPSSASLPEKTVNFFSPRGSASVRLTDAVSVQGSVYRAYRTPTLNELHRGFRVGNTQTNPNPLLEPERLTGVEGGLLWSRSGLSARVTAFFNQLDEAIANVTLSSTPALITRERQNADGARATGVEIEGDFRPTPRLTVNALAAFTSSHFRNITSQPALEGNRVPQVPVYQVGGGATYLAPYEITTSAQLRIFGSQFDDDLNTFELDGFAVLDLYAGRTFGRVLNGFVAVENLFDEEYDVGRTPIRTIGWPRTVRVGLRVFLP